MIKFRRLISIILIATVLVLPSCSVSKSDDSEELIVGVENITGNFNPLYAADEADKLIAEQVFGYIQKKSTDNSMVNSYGGISYELVGDSQVKYTVTLRDDLFFSDGTHVTVDDLIFVYHLIADATYDGVYSNWHLNDIEGIDEYYYDDEKYDASVAAIENKLINEYSASAISKSEYIAYLIMTSLEGKFEGGLDSKSPNGKTWREYFTAIGYSEELSALGHAPSDIDLLKIAARAEVENNPLAYSPENYYRDILYSEYLGKNYSDGINVTKISGINKVNDYSCTILFNSKNINTVSEINIPIISKSVYEAEYVKGHASVIREKSDAAIGCGAYIVNDVSDNEVTLTANPNYYGGTPDFAALRFIDLAKADKDPVEAVNDGTADIVTVSATDDVISELDSDKIKTVLSNQECYYSVFFNSNTLELEERKALAGLCDFSSLLNDEIGPYYTALHLPLSIRFPEYPADVKAPVYNESAYSEYASANADGIRALTAYCDADENSFEMKILEAYKGVLKEKGIALTVVMTDKNGLDYAIQSGEADLWVSLVPDGATVDKYDYFNSNGMLNKTGLDSTDIDLATLKLRSAIGFYDKEGTVKALLMFVMEQAVECPVCQLQTVTAYNIEKISPDSFNVDFSYDGFTEVIPLLKRNEQKG